MKEREEERERKEKEKKWKRNNRTFKNLQENYRKSHEYSSV